MYIVMVNDLHYQLERMCSHQGGKHLATSVKHFPQGLAEVGKPTLSMGGTIPWTGVDAKTMGFPSRMLKRQLN